MATKIYYNTQLTLAVGAQDAFADLSYDVVDGYVYRISEADLAIYTAGDTANAVHHLWMSVLKDGRPSYSPYTEGFAADILSVRSNVKATYPYYTGPLESSDAGGYLADDPYFESAVRLGVSTNSNVAGSDVLVSARITAERVRSTADIRQLMYNRAYT